jgi:hypothetical protein
VVGKKAARLSSSLKNVAWRQVLAGELAAVNSAALDRRYF